VARSRRWLRRGSGTRPAANAAPTPPPAPPYRSAQQAQTFMAMFQAGTASGRSAVQAQAHSQAHAYPQTQVHAHPRAQDRDHAQPPAHSPDRFGRFDAPGDNPGAPLSDSPGRTQARAPYDPSLPASPQLPQRSGEFHEHHP
ncbi:hypothetical protein AB0N76_29805, partial [Kitasatospora sp. NPDC093806]